MFKDRDVEPGSGFESLTEVAVWPSRATGGKSGKSDEKNLFQLFRFGEIKNKGNDPSPPPFPTFKRTVHEIFGDLSWPEQKALGIKTTRYWILIFYYNF